ncbi:MAG: type II toxin-antitoxin system death-on-curing family toxin [Gammaproteobacteria bacterium]|nr:type II toxin-antitoxin system death-on-curing family toxin [Gammaproteobacteria bacterium]MYF29489.1 type II toxin-antitoxin system death-on-curing family toxin [Gammaproteobacteria bacterium]MYK45582.1 type II toxin-antitoxin system death-on-curing family toxin [Gammaproteobacteria bacterium]
MGFEVVRAIHERQIDEHGGADGIRDLGVIESALARPINLAGYADPDAADLAAAYAFGLAKSHGFVDGNKRTGWVAARLFLADNDFRIEFEPVDAIQTMVAVAAGSMGEADLAVWFRDRVDCAPAR